MERRRNGMLASVVISIFLANQVYGQTQTFRETPSNTEVIAGQTAILKCVVDNKVGALQWTKDGFALGFSRSIPGFSRYSMIGSENFGENNLMITNTNLRDDADYECQVGPALNNPPLQAQAHLIVLIPPESPIIVDHANGTTVDIQYKQESVNLTCEAKNGKPAASLLWLRNGEEIKEDVTYSTEDLSNKLQNAKSVLTIKPRKEDNGNLITCRAMNSAMIKPLETTVQLSVLHPPGQPEITGYKNGQVVKTGDTLKLKCTSQGGNPLAQLVWYKNDEQIDFSYNMGANQAVNELVFTVDSTDNLARYSCEASNIITTTPLKAEIQLIVQFAPSEVKILGHQNAKAGDTITMSCESSNSNPAALITWFSRGRQLTGEGIVTKTKPSPRGGFISYSNITVTLTNQESKVIYSCHGTNDALGVTVMATAELSVQYPPEQPDISGYTSGTTVEAGTIQRMLCVSVGGNPMATITWWKGDKRIQAANRKVGNIASSEISFIANANDNGAEYRCNATNPATTSPLIAAVTIVVFFAPDSVTIAQQPEQGKAGEAMTLTCKSGSSNPASQISWWKNKQEIPGIDSGVTDADHGGKATASRLEFIPSAEDDGAVYTCRANNDRLQKSSNNAITLNVLYKPSFNPDLPTKLDLVEYQAAVLNLTAQGNPSDITYTWYKDGEKLNLKKHVIKKRDLSVSHFSVDGGVLYLNNVTRIDKGQYSCEASNLEGKTTHIVAINVQYPAGISRITTPVLVDQGSTAKLECQADANPVVTDMIRWQREGYEMVNGKVEQTFEDEKSYLTVYNVTKADSGSFKCIAQNGIGTANIKVADLVVKYAPEIDKSPQYSKSASDKGATAKLVCKAQGAPSIDFFWYRGGTPLDTTSNKYIVGRSLVSNVHYESYLSVVNVTKEDYAAYVCVAKNELGQDSTTITLDGTSRPDPPYNLVFYNATHDSISLSWTPGFDGGSPQWFQVRYIEKSRQGFKYADVEPKGATMYKIKGLALGTEYEVTVRAINMLGESEFAEKGFSAKTDSVAPDSQSLGQADSDDSALIIILCVTIFGMILLGVNGLLICLFIRKRRKRLEKEGTISDTMSQANTIEMIGPNGGPVFPPIGDEKGSYTTYDTGDFTDDYSARFDPYQQSLRRISRSLFTVSRYSWNQDEEGLVGRRCDFPPPPPMLDPIYGPKPGMYPPPPPPPGMGPMGGPMGPGVDSQRSFFVNKRDPYMEDQLGPAQNWKPPYEGPYGSLPRKRPEGPGGDDDVEYAEQLRKMQKGIYEPGRGLQPPGAPGSRPSSRASSKLPPPPPPLRTSSKDATGSLPRAPREPPLPSRNYAAEEVPSGRPPTYDSLSRNSQPPPPPPSQTTALPNGKRKSTDMKGHLV